MYFFNVSEILGFFVELITFGLKIIHVTFPVSPGGNEGSVPPGCYELNCLGGITIGSARQDLAASCGVMIRECVCRNFEGALQGL